MMSRGGALTSLFADDPFFSQGQLLWPLHHRGLSSLQQEFSNRRAKLATSLLRELHDGHHLLRMSPLHLLSPTMNGLNDENQQLQVAPVQDQQRQVQQPADNNNNNNGDLLVTLDARGYAPSDITVKLEGHKLAVVAMKQAGAEETETSSSASSCAAFRAAASSQMGFVQKIDLPPHLDLSGLSCSLMDDGQLRIHAPAAKQAIAHESAIDDVQDAPVLFRTSLEFPITKDKTEADTP